MSSTRIASDAAGQQDPFAGARLTDSANIAHALAKSSSSTNLIRATLPAEQRANDRYAKDRQLEKDKGTHSIATAYKSSTNLGASGSNPSSFFEDRESRKANYYFKENETKRMAELEAFAWGCFHLLIPAQVPRSAHAIYNVKTIHTPDRSGKIGQYRGILTKTIENFKPPGYDDLTEDTYKPHFISKGLTIEHLEHEDEQDKAEPKKAAERAPEDVIRAIKVDNNRVSITVDDLIRFRRIKGIAYSLMASWLFNEDDLHRNNIALDGKRIDFDMTFWYFFYHFKNLSIFDKPIRQPKKSILTATPTQISNFPDLGEATPYYHPTTTLAIPTKNKWTQRENDIFKQLKQNPIFNFYKYVVLLKFILCGSDIYKQIAKLHVRPLSDDEKEDMTDRLANHLENRHTNIKNAALQTPEFLRFVVEDGEKALNIIQKEITQHNEQFQHKVDKAQKKLQLLDKKGDNESEAERAQLLANKVAYQQQLIEKGQIERGFNLLLTQAQQKQQELTESFVQVKPAPKPDSRETIEAQIALAKQACYSSIHQPRP